MSQFIKYETTEVSAHKSAREIQDLCRKYGAKRVETRYVDGQIETIRFILRTELGDMPVLVRAPSEKVYQLFRKHRPRGNAIRQRKQAHKIAWRHMKDLTEQRLLAAFVNIEDPAEAFMAHIEQEPGTTTGDLMLKQIKERGGFDKVLMIGDGS